MIALRHQKKIAARFILSESPSRCARARPDAKASGVGLSPQSDLNIPSANCFLALRPSAPSKSLLCAPEGHVDWNWEQMICWGAYQQPQYELCVRKHLHACLACIDPLPPRWHTFAALLALLQLAVGFGLRVTFTQTAFGRSDAISRGGARDSVPCLKWAKRESFVAVSKT